MFLFVANLFAVLLNKNLITIITNTYFIIIFFQIYEAPENTRPKKWSSKLKLNTSGSSKSSEKSPESPYMYGTVSGQDGSALSKSMKYAETWLYGSVRTQTPTIRPSVFSTYPEVSGPVLISTPQKPTPHNYAVILCSCPEYLNGTKKTNSTKVSICKKCKGSRLPLTIAESPRMLVGGTVRGSQVSRDVGLLRAGTVRVQNTKARPTILKPNGDSDPYDLMRRSRLVPPHETRIGSQFSTSRSRAKSISPCRIKTKQPSPEIPNKSRSKSVSRVNDLWIEEEVNTVDKKKSILSCDINPYDLVKPSGEDYSDVFQESHKNSERSIKKSKTDTNVKAIGGQRIRVSNEPKPSSLEEVSVYDPVNFDLKNYDFKSTDMSSALSLPNIKKESNKFASLSKNSSKKVVSISSTNRTKQKSVSPKRPPRRVRNHKIDDDSESDNQRLPERSFTKKSSTENSRSPKYKNNNTDTIKSILKKPRSYELSDSSTKIETSDDLYEIKRTNSSQFYLPKPTDKGLISPQNIYQRKRVQFLVENEETKVIYTADLNLHENNISNENPNIIVEVATEEEIVAEGDIVSHSLEINESISSQETTNSQNDLEVYEDIQMQTQVENVIENIPTNVPTNLDGKLVTEEPADNNKGNYIFYMLKIFIIKAIRLFFIFF